MAGIDLDTLMRPVADAAPCGDDLEYDPDFGAMERAARGSAEHVMGEAVIEARQPDWPAVQRLATSLFARTKDLRVAVYLARALLNTEGLAGFRDGLALIRALIETHWDAIHPRLDPEEGNDPTLRVNTLAALYDAGTVLTELRLAPVVASRAFGSVSVRDIALATGELKAVSGETVKDVAEVKGAFLDCEPADLLAVLDAARGCASALTAIEQTLTAKVGAAKAADFAPAHHVFRMLLKFLEERVGERGLRVAPVAAASGAGEATAIPATLASAPAAVAPMVTGEIKGREDVVRLIDRICDYYDRCEPASPVPLLLRRAKRLVSKSFIDVLRDIAPDAVAQAEAIRGPDAV